jgi:epoxyqueuosine reductase QueG
MHNITKKEIKDFALSHGLDLIGFANIERFKDAPKRMSPASIFPEAKTIIVVGKRIVRGAWRGIEEGTYWPNYTYFGYHGMLNTHFIHLPLYETVCFIENAGFEAVPYYPGPPETQPVCRPLRKGGAAPDVHLSIRIAGTAAGIGEMGWSKVFLTKEYGPRQRLNRVLYAISAWRV